MTDAPLIEKRLALIETCVADLRRLARPDRLAVDVREERFAEHTLQMRLQPRALLRRQNQPALAFKLGKFLAEQGDAIHSPLCPDARIEFHKNLAHSIFPQFSLIALRANAMRSVTTG